MKTVVLTYTLNIILRIQAHRDASIQMHYVKIGFPNGSVVYCVLGDINRFSKYGEVQFYFSYGSKFRSSLNINRP